MNKKKVSKKQKSKEIPVTFRVTFNSKRKLSIKEANHLIQFMGNRLAGFYSEPPEWADGVLTDTVNIKAI